MAAVADPRITEPRLGAQRRQRRRQQHLQEVALLPAFEFESWPCCCCPSSTRMALSRGVLLLGVLLLAVALLPQQAQAGVWDDIRTSFQDAWAKTKGVFQGATA